MLVVCKNNHIPICFDVENLATSEEIVYFKGKCPLCEEMDRSKEHNERGIKLIDEKVKLNEEINELQTEGVELKAEVIEMREDTIQLKKRIQHMFETELKNILANCSS